MRRAGGKTITFGRVMCSSSKGLAQCGDSRNNRKSQDFNRNHGGAVVRELRELTSLEHLLCASIFTFQSSNSPGVTIIIPLYEENYAHTSINGAP